MDKMLIEMEKYIKKIKEDAKNNPEKAKQEATAALIRTGVLNPDGTPKEQIVNRI